MANEDSLKSMAESESLLNIPRPESFDLAPFLTAPACHQAAAKTSNVPVIVPIPAGVFPSPFAEGITPDKIKELHDHLNGSPGSNEPQHKRSREVWLSWKRAWDLNNNHFIEGRVNPAWVGAKYKKQKLAFDTARAKKRSDQMATTRFKPSRKIQPTNGPYRRIFSTGTPVNRPGRRWIKTGYEARIVHKSGPPTVALPAGRIAFQEDVTRKKTIQRFPDGQPTKKYAAGEEVPLIHKKVPLFKITKEHVAVPATKPQLQSYEARTAARALGAQAAKAKEDDFKIIREVEKKKTGAILERPFNMSTLDPPNEDAIEDRAIEYDEVLMKRAIGDLQEIDVLTESRPNSRPSLVDYSTLVSARGATGPHSAIFVASLDAELPITRIIKVAKYRITADQLVTNQIINHPSIRPHHVQTYTGEVDEIDIAADRTPLNTTEEPTYVRVQAGAQVDEVQKFSGLFEWREIEAPAAKRKVVSLAHTVNAPLRAALRAASSRRTNKKVSFSISADREESPEQGALGSPKNVLQVILAQGQSTGSNSFVENGTAPTDVDDPSVMFPTEFDIDDPYDIAQKQQQSYVASLPDTGSHSDDDDARPVFGPGARFQAPPPSGDYLDDKDAVIPTLNAADVMEADGTSGGFLGLKQRAEYQFDEEGPWKDNIENTVWRPRRTGETDLKIEMDEDFQEQTDLTILGGVDCGRIPYPVLRSVDKYVEIIEADASKSYIKKKVWDGVTGTIFNMPSKPADGDEPVDDRQVQMQGMFGDASRDNVIDKNVFALDIRRVNRNDTAVRKRAGPTGTLVGKETWVPQSWQNPLRSYPDLAEDSAYWVTDKQEQLRDVPYRSWPPVAEPEFKDKDVLYTDDRLFEEEAANDSGMHSQYFVTNLHGGTLIINGVEVRKGCIAGPLPEFAVIECPGNQVAFWHGPGGRFFGEQSPRRPDPRRWATLRSMKGFENFGLTAGQVWNIRIKDRLRRELTGNRLEDDQDWAFWKTVVTPEPVTALTSPTPFPYLYLQLDRDNARTTNILPAYTADPNVPTSFSSRQDELRWLKTRAIPFESAAAEALRDQTQRLTPSEWALLNPGATPPDPPEVTAQTIEDIHYAVEEAAFVARQSAAMVAYIAAKKVAEKAKRDAALDKANKRKTQSDLLFGAPPAKKTRIELDKEQAKADRVVQAAFLQATEDQRIWQEYLFRQVSIGNKKAANPGYTDADADKELQDQVDWLEAQWQAVNVERLANGLPVFKRSPAARARLDKVRLGFMLKKQADADAAALKQAADHKAILFAAAQAKKDARDAIKAKAEAASLKRTADAAGLTEYQKRAVRRKTVYDAMVPAVQAGQEIKQVYNVNKVRAARLNKAVNGQFLAPGTQPVVAFPTPLKKPVGNAPKSNFATSRPGNAGRIRPAPPGTGKSGGAPPKGPPPPGGGPRPPSPPSDGGDGDDGSDGGDTQMDDSPDPLGGAGPGLPKRIPARSSSIVSSSTTLVGDPGTDPLDPIVIPSDPVQKAPQSAAPSNFGALLWARLRAEKARTAVTSAPPTSTPTASAPGGLAVPTTSSGPSQTRKPTVQAIEEDDQDLDVPAIRKSAVIVIEEDDEDLHDDVPAVRKPAVIVIEEDDQVLEDDQILDDDEDLDYGAGDDDDVDDDDPADNDQPAASKIPETIVQPASGTPAVPTTAQLSSGLGQSLAPVVDPLDTPVIPPTTAQRSSGLGQTLAPVVDPLDTPVNSPTTAQLSANLGHPLVPVDDPASLPSTAKLSTNLGQSLAPFVDPATTISDLDEEDADSLPLPPILETESDLSEADQTGFFDSDPVNPLSFAPSSVTPGSPRDKTPPVPESRKRPVNLWSQRFMNESNHINQLDYVLTWGLQHVDKAPLCYYQKQLINNFGTGQSLLEGIKKDNPNATMTTMLQAERRRIINQAARIARDKATRKAQADLPKLSAFVRETIESQMAIRASRTAFALDEYAKVAWQGMTGEYDIDPDIDYSGLLHFLCVQVETLLDQVPLLHRQDAVGAAVARALTTDEIIARLPVPPAQRSFTRFDGGPMGRTYIDL